MSKYTTQVRFICEHYAGLTDSVGYNDVEDVISNSRSKVFDFNYPIFDEDYRSVLETKILKHFYTREIGEETVGLWKLRLNTKMNEIMPYYNQLYNSELIEFDPMKDTDVQTIGDKENNRTEDGETSGTDAMTGTIVDEGEKNITGRDGMTGTIVDDGSRNSVDGGRDISQKTGQSSDAVKNDHWDYYSDTPQGQVGTLANLQYLTNARHITDDGTGSTSSSSATDTKTYGRTNDTDIDNTRTYNTINSKTEETENGNTRTYNTANNKSGTSNKEIKDINEYTEHVTGKRWADSYSDLLMKFRNTFLNIDLLILDELDELFLQIW